MDDLAIGGNGVPGLAIEGITLAQFAAPDGLHAAIGQLQLGGRVLPQFSKRSCLCLAPRFGDGFREVGKEQGDEEDQEDHGVVTEAALGVIAAEGAVQRDQQHDRRADLHGEHHRVAQHGAWGELHEALHERFAELIALKEGG